MTIRDLFSVDVSVWEISISYTGSLRNSKFGNAFEFDNEDVFIVPKDSRYYSFENIKTNEVINEIVNVFGDLEIRKIIPRDNCLGICCYEKEDGK